MSDNTSARAGDGKAAQNWEGAEEWMPLAWELCANECGEEACTELIWEGGPIPEPWGDRWLKYEDQAKEMIAMVRKLVPSDAAPAGQWTVSVAGPDDVHRFDAELDALRFANHVNLTYLADLLAHPGDEVLCLATVTDTSAQLSPSPATADGSQP
jgi:hypothetical protein